MGDYPYSYDVPHRYRRRVHREIYWGRVFLSVFLISGIISGAVLFVVFGRDCGALSGCVPAKSYVTVPAIAYHYVAAGTYSTKAEAVKSSLSLKNAGGAGYVLSCQEGFRTVAAVYRSSADAVTVSARLIGEGVSAELYSVSCKAAKIEIVSTEAQAKEFAAHFTYLCELFDSIYRIVLDLDADKITESHAYMQVSALKTKVGQKYAGLSAYSDYTAASQAIFAYSQILDLLSGTLDYAFGTSFPVNLKYSICALSDIYTYLVTGT
ncbi:MAG: hypothetical protein FWD58_06775 [Firmicutes bacterium]|nr:hypothetical protein [Bacillota bacterium]